MITKDQKLAVSEPFRSSERDMGNSAVQVAVMTSRINHLTGHLSDNKKDHSARLGLLKLVGKRRRLLSYLNDTDSKLYQDVLAKLKLRK